MSATEERFDGFSRHGGSSAGRRERRGGSELTPALRTEVGRQTTADAARRAEAWIAAQLEHAVNDLIAALGREWRRVLRESGRDTFLPEADEDPVAYVLPRPWRTADGAQSARPEDRTVRVSELRLGQIIWELYTEQGVASDDPRFLGMLEDAYTRVANEWELDASGRPLEVCDPRTGKLRKAGRTVARESVLESLAKAERNRWAAQRRRRRERGPTGLPVPIHSVARGDSQDANNDPLESGVARELGMPVRERETDALLREMEAKSVLAALRAQLSPRLQRALDDIIAGREVRDRADEKARERARDAARRLLPWLSVKLP